MRETHAMPAHIHMWFKTRPKHPVSFIIRFIKGKSAVRVHRELLNDRRMRGLHLWPFGLRTVGRDEAAVRGRVLVAAEPIRNRRGPLTLHVPADARRGYAT